MKLKIYTAIALTLMIAVNGCTNAAGLKKKEPKPQVVHFAGETIYRSFHVNGCFMLYDPQRQLTVYVNEAQTDERFTPASTFKICNSLIGLETGVIPDTSFIIKWNGQHYAVPEWNADHSLKQAYKHSTVWYYQELARLVGGKRMKHWLKKADYGNADTSGGIDLFWLTGNLRITPKEQINFLEKLRENSLPFSQKTMELVKDMMIEKDSNGCIVRSKTGWGFQDEKDIGWYVGWIETSAGVYYFANCIQSQVAAPNFAEARKEITRQLLKQLKLPGYNPSHKN